MFNHGATQCLSILIGPASFSKLLALGLVAPLLYLQAPGSFGIELVLEQLRDG